MILKYTAKVWLTSVLLTPFLIIIYESIVDQFFRFSEIIPITIMTIIVGFIASIPNFVLLYLFTKKMHQLYSTKNIKILVTIVAFFLTYFLFSFLEWWLHDDFDVGLITLAYSFTLTIGICFFPLGERNEGLH